MLFLHYYIYIFFFVVCVVVDVERNEDNFIIATTIRRDGKFRLDVLF